MIGVLGAGDTETVTWPVPSGAHNLTWEPLHVQRKGDVAAFLSEGKAQIPSSHLGKGSHFLRQGHMPFRVSSPLPCRQKCLTRCLHPEMTCILEMGFY